MYRKLAASVGLAALILQAPQTLADDAVTVDSFVGCWLTAGPAPVVILSDGHKPDGYQVFREDMMLTISRIKQTDLVRGDYYAFTDDLSSVIGPEYVDGVFNPAEGVLTIGEPKGGLNRVHLIEPDRILYVHTRAADTADMSVRHLNRIECDDAKTKAEELQTAQK